jgi:hypothetical protein
MSVWSNFFGRTIRAVALKMSPRALKGILLPVDKRERLNILKAASKSAERLASALNWLAGTAAAAGLLGVIVNVIEIAYRWHHIVQAEMSV